MTRIARDVLNVTFAKIANKRFFFIVNRIYESHKHFNLEIIKIKIIVRQYDQHKHKYKTIMTKHVNFAQIEKLFKNEIKNEIDDRNKILLKKSYNYISNNNEITQKHTMINVKLLFF